jgi:hypothetical protein
MSDLKPLSLEALVHDAERPAVIAAAELLSESLGRAASSASWPVQLSFRSLGASLPPEASPSAIILSLLPEVAAAGEPIADTEARWRPYLDALLAGGVPVFLCTVFRHLNDRPRDGGSSPVLERIRRLNRMALDLSHDLGVAVIDVDRAFAHIGGRTLQTDFRQAGVLAAEVGGHTIAWALLSFGLDDSVDPALQEGAKRVLGSLEQIDVLVNRRLRNRAAQTPRG